jgi:hypothetical protein
MVSIERLESLILFLRVVACAVDRFPELLFDFEMSFFVEIFRTHFREQKIALLVLPLLMRYLEGCEFVEILFQVLRDGHFRAGIRALIVIDSLLQRVDGDIKSELLCHCDGDDLMNLLDVDDPARTVTLRFIHRVLVELRDSHLAATIVDIWRKSALIDYLATLIDTIPSVEHNDEGGSESITRRRPPAGKACSNWGLMLAAATSPSGYSLSPTNFEVTRTVSISPRWPCQLDCCPATNAPGRHLHWRTIISMRRTASGLTNIPCHHIRQRADFGSQNATQAIRAQIRRKKMDDPPCHGPSLPFDHRLGV